MSSEDFRLSFREARDVLARRLAEPAPGRIQLLAGPRQVGKTTLLLEIAARHGNAAIYAAADGPEAAVPGFWERLWVQAEEIASREGSAVVLVDEAHLLQGLASHLKGEWDHLRRRKLPVQVVATGSSALRLAAGSRESLAGRFERITLTHWSASPLVSVFGAPPAEASELLVTMGSYPGAFALRGDLPRWSAYVRDAILEPPSGGTSLRWRHPGQRVSYWREEPFEVDGVLEGSWGSWVIEVKTGSISTADLKGIGEFTRRSPGFRPLVLCDEGGDSTVERAGLPEMAWRAFLQSGPPRSDIASAPEEQRR